MIVCKEFPGKEFATKEELFKELILNEKTLIAQKKGTNKEADSVNYFIEVDNGKGEIVKASSTTSQLVEAGKMRAKLVINTTGIYDSHGDVHIKGLWNKSLKEQRSLLLLQEHQMKFDKIITDNVSASAKTMSWKTLGFDYEGNAQALVFEAEIDSGRNAFMFEQYAKGYVREHSVGMRYVKLEMGINSEEKWAENYKETWDKYYDEIVNKEDVDANGYFWAVTEAKIIEGSAVVRGSNFATPTISVEAVKNDTSTKTEAGTTPLQEPKKKRIFINAKN